MLWQEGGGSRGGSGRGKERSREEQVRGGGGVDQRVEGAGNWSRVRGAVPGREGGRAGRGVCASLPNVQMFVAY